MSASSLVQVREGSGSWVSPTNGLNVSPGATVSIKLASTTDVAQWALQVFGVDEVTAINPTLIGVDNGTHIVTTPSTVVTFTMPSGSGIGRSVILRSTVNGGGFGLISTFGIYTLTSASHRVGAVGERFEGDPDFGWAKILNSLIRTGGVQGPEGPEGPEGPPGATGATGPGGSGSNFIVGEIKAFTGSTPPSGWVVCDGSDLSRIDYAELNAIYAADSYPFGSGDGSLTFTIPDAQGRTLIGSGAGSLLTNRDLGDQLGVESVLLDNTTAGIPVYNPSLSSGPSSVVLSSAYGDITLPHENMQPSLTVNYILYTGVL